MTMHKTPDRMLICSYSHYFTHDVSHFFLSCQYLVILLYYFLSVNFKDLKWIIRHDYCPQGVYTVLVFLLRLTQFFIKIGCLKD